MSQTLVQIHTNVRALLREYDPADYAVDSFTVYHLIVDRAQALGHPLVSGLTTTNSAFTYTVASLDDYTLPSTGITYSSIIMLWVPSLGRQLWRKGLEEVNLYRRGLITGQSSQGEPYYYAVYEANDQTVKIRLDRAPATSRAVDVMHSRLTPTTFTDATVVAVSEPMQRVIEKKVAVTCLAMMTPQERQERGLGSEYYARGRAFGLKTDWEREAAEDFRRAMEAASRMTRATEDIWTGLI